MKKTPIFLFHIEYYYTMIFTVLIATKALITRAFAGKIIFHIMMKECYELYRLS